MKFFNVSICARLQTQKLPGHDGNHGFGKKFMRMNFKKDWNIFHQMEMNNIDIYFINLIKAYMINAKGQGKKKDHIFGLILFLIIKILMTKMGGYGVSIVTLSESVNCICKQVIQNLEKLGKIVQRGL